MIPFLDLHKINARFESEFQEVFKNFLDTGRYILGHSVETFEKEYASYCHVKHCIGVANGLDALRLVLEGYKELGKLKSGDEVLIAANTFIATVIAAKQAGLLPVLAEAEKETYNFDFQQLEKYITPKTRVIMPVHLYGQLADMEAVLAFAKKHNLLVIEDAAQSHGAAYPFDISQNPYYTAAYSFYPAKNLGALGDGGAVVTNDTALAEIVKKWRNYGTSSKYINEFCGINSRLDEIQAALLSVKLPFLDTDNQKRRTIAERYLHEIQNPKIILPKVNRFEGHVFHLFVIRTPNREQLQHYLQQNHIATLIHYPIPPHNQRALKEFNHLNFPVTEEIHHTVLSLPMSPVLEEKEVSYIIDTINRY